MTAPISPELIAAQGDEALDAEEAAALAASQQLRAEIAAVVAVALATWDESDDRRRTVLSVAKKKLTSIEPKTRDALVSAFRDALALGIIHGNEHIEPSGLGSLRAALPADVRMAARQSDQHARRELRAAAHGLAPDVVRTEAQLQEALAGAQRAVSRTEATARWGVNRAHSAGVQAVAEAVGEDRLWVAERDACVHCLAYAGLIAPTDFPFPAGLTFGRKPLSRDPVPNPPLHPNCRCHIVVWRREWSRDYARALQREAKRSIVRGFSLESESNRTRLDAAERLLAAGAGLPASVEAYGRSAVRQGRFPRGRRFPV